MNFERVMYFKYRIMSDHSKREYRNIGKHLFFYHTLSSYPFLVVSRTRNLFRRVIKFSPTMKHARAHTHGHGVVARKVITFRRQYGRQNSGISSVEISERKKEDYMYPAKREKWTCERASIERARTRACMQLRIFTRANYSRRRCSSRFH